MADEVAPHALVIGASGDIGSCVAELLCSRGMGVTGIDLRESSFACPGYSHFCADMSRPEAIDEVLAFTKEKLLSYVINLAGGAEPKELNRPEVADFAFESLTETFGSNFQTSLAAIVIAKSVSDASCGRDVSVTLCSSVNAVGNYQYPIYSASKSTVESLVLTQAVPLGALGIRINAVRLGTVLTKASLNLHGEAGTGHYEPLLKLTSLARFVTPREAAVALVAAAVDITGMTGEVITVDAGQSIPGNRGLPASFSAS